MRITGISTTYNTHYSVNLNRNKIANAQGTKSSANVNFRGPKGAIIGGVIASAAAIIFPLPTLLVTAAGMITGSMIEDNNDNNNPDGGSGGDTSF